MLEPSSHHPPQQREERGRGREGGRERERFFDDEHLAVSG